MSGGPFLLCGGRGRGLFPFTAAVSSASATDLPCFHHANACGEGANAPTVAVEQCGFTTTDQQLYQLPQKDQADSPVTDFLKLTVC